MKGYVARGAAMVLLLLVGLLIRPGTAEETPTTARETLNSKTAALRNGWRPSLFDFAWEYGEALTDRPGRGTRRLGGWIDVSNGSGAASQHNGGALLQSKYGRFVPKDAGAGDFGTTSITLAGNAQTYGRWEMRIRPWVIENNAKDYRIRFELIPVDPAQYLCGARSITVADLTPRKPAVGIAAYTPSRNRTWRATKSTSSLSNVSKAYAVEVTKDHISWFIDGDIVGTLKARAAIPRVPLTMRISLIGQGSTEMNHTYVVMDWMRAYTLKRGKQRANGARLSAGKHNLHC
ncbi:MAG TPA: hypothetical protein VLI04_02120 [Nocardioidaceae bacterium]|nr:hypothetical protein [Nocardioidaceae bacterium]